MQEKSNKKPKISVGGVIVTTGLVERVVEVLKSFDRMRENPDDDFLRAMVGKQLETEGLLRLILFVCPKFNTQALLGKRKEEYFPTKVVPTDLFEPRVRKVMEIRDALFKLGVVSTLEVVIGDNDFSVYIAPFLEGFRWDEKLVLERQRLYRKSFEGRVRKLFGMLSEVWGLAEYGITYSDEPFGRSEEEFNKEMKFFDWLFSEDGPYKGAFKFDEQTLQLMVGIKFAAYGNQGKFLQEIGGVLLQTEGPGVWLLRTQMLRCTGAEAVPAIYPWIRRDE